MSDKSKGSESLWKYPGISNGDHKVGTPYHFPEVNAVLCLNEGCNIRILVRAGRLRGIRPQTGPASLAGEAHSAEGSASLTQSGFAVGTVEVVV